MPLYEYECPHCGHHWDRQLPLSRCDEAIFCNECGMKMRKMFNKITPLWPAQTRKWGTSFYRSHDKGKQVSKPKLPTNSPSLKMCCKCGVSEEAAPQRLIWRWGKWWCHPCYDVKKGSL